MDLGADTWQTFRYITFPTIRTAILAGGLLAFALSFDEIVVTTFTAGTQETIPIWIFNHLRQANQRPIVNVVALVLILLSTIPVYLASRLTTGASGRPASALARRRVNGLPAQAGLAREGDRGEDGDRGERSGAEIRR